MTDLKEIFGRRSDGDGEIDIPAEDLRHVRVMQDDLDELSGKAAAKPVPASDLKTANPETTGNPFLDPEMDTRTAVASEQVREVSAVAREAAPAVKQPAGKRFRMRTPKPENLRLAGIVFLLFILAGGVVVLVREKKQSPEEATNQQVDTRLVPEPSTPAIPIEEGPYSASRPNYLHLDPESDTSSPEGIQSVISDAESKVSDMAAMAPVEFLVRDVDNNPIAFSRFAYLLGLSIPVDVLSSLDESFSLYLIPDGARVHRALSVAVKDQSALTSSLTATSAQEAVLPSSFAPLLYGSQVAVPTQAVFRDGSFGTLRTRFAIIDAASDRSFDYALLGGRLVLGTGKDAFRAALGQAVGR